MADEITFDFARRDDCLDQLVPSDLRQLVAERDRLRAELAERDGQEPAMWAAEQEVDGQFIDGRKRKVWWECKEGVGDAFYRRPPSPRPAVPEGYAIVPLEPTEEMLSAASESDIEYTRNNFGRDAPIVNQGGYDHYVAMVGAAQAEKGGDGDA